jgi:hypothetical protein
MLALLKSSFGQMMLMGWVRQGLTLVGGGLVAGGYITNKGDEALVGIGLSVAGFVFSTLSKYHNPVIPNPTPIQKVLATK